MTTQHISGYGEVVKVTFPIRTFDWAPGEPNNSAEECITLFPAGYGHGWDGWDYKWCDGGCGAQFNFICEK